MSDEIFNRIDSNAVVQRIRVAPGEVVQRLHRQVEMIAAVALKATRSAAVLRSIKIA